MRIFDHDVFYGDVQAQRTLPGLTLAHRVADRPADAVETHTHLDAHLVLITSGEYLSSASGKTSGLIPLVYNPPGTTHRDHFRNGAGSFFTVSFAPDQFGPYTDAIAMPASFLVDSRSHGLARALLWATVRGVRSNDLHAEFLAHELLESLCTDGRREQSKHLPGWLRKVHERLMDGYAQDLTVRELAAAAGVHPVHLARTFRACFGCTPGQLIQQSKLERAADLLLSSAMRLADVASACGFSDQSHLTTSFRRVYGMAPGRFRKTVSRHAPRPRSNVSFLQDRRPWG